MRKQYHYTRRKVYTERLDLLNDDSVFGYVAGLVATDGSIDKDRPRILLALHEGDEATVSFVASRLVHEPYHLLRWRGRVGLSITARSIVAELAALGIGPCKTTSLDVDLNGRSGDFLSHFLRGVVDGDGCVRIEEKPTLSEIGITSASEAFLLRLQALWGGRMRRRKSGHYDLRWNGYKARDLAHAVPCESWTMARKTVSIEILKSQVFWCEGDVPYIGVKRQDGRFRAMIQHNRKRYSLGMFKTAEEAARRYNEAAVALKGPAARLNAV